MYKYYPKIPYIPIKEMKEKIKNPNHFLSLEDTKYLLENCTITEKLSGEHIGLVWTGNSILIQSKFGIADGLEQFGRLKEFLNKNIDLWGDLMPETIIYGVLSLTEYKKPSVKPTDSIRVFDAWVGDSFLGMENIKELCSLLKLTPISGIKKSKVVFSELYGTIPKTSKGLVLWRNNLVGQIENKESSNVRKLERGNF